MVALEMSVLVNQFFLRALEALTLLSTRFSNNSRIKFLAYFDTLPHFFPV